MEADVTHVFWLIFRSAVAQHIADEAKRQPMSSDTEDQYRIRAEKAGIVAVVNAVLKVERQAAE